MVNFMGIEHSKENESFGLINSFKVFIICITYETARRNGGTKLIPLKALSTKSRTVSCAIGEFLNPHFLCLKS